MKKHTVLLFLSSFAFAQPVSQPSSAQSPSAAQTAQYLVPLKPGVTDLEVTLDGRTYLAHCRAEGQMRVELPRTTFSVTAKVVVFNADSKKFTAFNTVPKPGASDLVLFCEMNNIRFAFGGKIQPVVGK